MIDSENRIWDDPAGSGKTVANHVVSENWVLTNVTGLQRRVVEMNTYKYINFQHVYYQLGSQTGTMKVYKSNHPGANAVSLTNWIDDSTGILGAGSVVVSATGTTQAFYEPTGPKSPMKYLLELNITASGTGVNVLSTVYIRKFY